MVNAYFFDSSALVKRYISEIGTSWILSITNSTESSYFAAVDISWAEVLSAIGRRQREGNLSEERVASILRDVRRDFKNLYQMVKIDSNLIERAGELVLQYLLRAYDAVQFASAL